MKICKLIMLLFLFLLAWHLDRPMLLHHEVRNLCSCLWWIALAVLVFFDDFSKGSTNA